MIADYSRQRSSLEKILQLVGYSAEADWMNNDADEDSSWSSLEVML